MIFESYVMFNGIPIFFMRENFGDRIPFVYRILLNIISKFQDVFFLLQQMFIEVDR